MKLKIYLFRHGQSTYNRDKKFTGWLDVKLTENGIKDAQEIGRKLMGKQIDVAYHSGMIRSYHTLIHVLRGHKGVDIRIDERLKERNYGELQGRTHLSYMQSEGMKDYAALVKAKRVPELEGIERKEFLQTLGEAKLQLARRSYTTPPPGGESIKDVEMRVNAFIKDLLKTMRTETINIAISAHGNSMRPFRRYFERLSVSQMIELENPWDDYFEYTITV